MCFEALFKKAHAVFNQGRGFERGEGKEFAIPLMTFLNIHVIDIFTIYRHFTRRGTLGLRPFILNEEIWENLTFTFFIFVVSMQQSTESA